MQSFEDRIAELTSGAAGIPLEQARELIERPRDPALGDFAVPAFTLAKAARKNPAELAATLASAIAVEAPIVAVKAVGPYVNFTLDRGAVARAVIERALAEGPAYGGSTRGAGKTIVVDFSSPNIAKPFGIHHLRSTVIGGAIGRILKACGYRVVGVNHLGDWGTQFGQLIVAYRRKGDAARLDREGIPYLLELYVGFNQDVKVDPKLQDEARAAFKALESGDPAVRALWAKFRDVSLTEFKRVYDRLGVSFDHYTGESFYESRMPGVLAELAAKGLLKESQDATIVDLSEEGLGVSVIKKKDDATLYVTRDLAAAEYRKQEFGFHKCLYVVGAAQSLHFKQLFRILELLGKSWARDCVHVPFGLLRFKDRKMSTRSGDILLLEEVLDRAVELAKETIEQKNPELKDKDRVARAVGTGAVIFNDLRSRRIKDVEFDWGHVLSFEGDTGPYLQYSHARIASIFRKAGVDPATLRGPFRFDLLTSDAERDLLRAVAQFPEAVERAAAEFEPVTVADHLLAVAAALNRFYIECRVLGTEHDLLNARLAAIRSAQIVLANGLEMAGIEHPEEM